MTCVADEVIAAWLSDSLPADERAAALAHAQGCAACTDVIGALFATGRSVAVAHLGRYVITGALGAGGMGVVMRATDPALGRDVAIKMVKATHTDDADDGFRHRMLGEAQAMAKVRHPNVVTVHDVGTAGDEIYVAMELVAGAPLGRWLADDPPVAARIEALLGIGRGLAAVHAAALVHRDIKPDNIVIRDDSTAVIVDFGLALGAGPAGSPAIAGTPTFIAPEVRAGAIATAASDQFQWWRLVEEGVGALPPRAAKRLAPALARGLDPDPARRHRDMAAAVAALAGAVAPRASSRWMIAIAAAGIASAAITAIATMHGGEDDACASAPLTGWSPARRAALATSLRDAGADAPRVLAALDRRAATTIALRAQACRAARSDDPAVAAQALRQRLCLEQTWLETDANLVGLAARTPALVRDAVDDLVTILPPTGCTGAHVPSVPAPPAPAIAARVRAIDARLREIATVLAPLTRLAEVRALGAEVGALGDGALASRWHSALASALMLGGDTAGALAELEQTARLAEAAGDDDGHARAMLDRLRVGFSRGDGDLERLRADAEAAAQRLGNPAIDAEVALGVALMQVSRGDAATARRAIEGALARYEPIAIDAHARIIAMWQNLGGACQAMGDLDAAQRAFDRGLALAHARWGDDHPETLELRGARATNLMYRGDLAAAEPELVAVAAGLTRQLGLASPTVMQARAYLCELALERRDPARALAACRDALASGEAAFGADSPQLGWPLTLQAQAQLASGAPADAVRSAERALAGYAHGTLAPTDIPLAQAYLAIALDRTGARDRARALAGSVARTLASMPDLAATLAELRAQFPGLPSE